MYVTLSELLFSAEPSAVEPIQEEEYELPEQSSPAPPPPRPTKSQPQPPTPPATQQDEVYEIADNPDDTSSEAPQPPTPPREEENYEIPGESPTPSPMRPPKIPQPQIPQPSDVSQKETREFYFQLWVTLLI